MVVTYIKVRTVFAFRVWQVAFTVIYIVVEIYSCPETKTDQSIVIGHERTKSSREVPCF